MGDICTHVGEFVCIDTGNWHRLCMCMYVCARACVGVHVHACAFRCVCVMPKFCISLSVGGYNH